MKAAGARLNFGGAPLAHLPGNGYAPLDAATPVDGRTDDTVEDASEAAAAPLALVLLPGKELADQAGACFEQYGGRLGVRAAVLVTGGGAKEQRRMLRERAPQVVAGTPPAVLEAVRGGLLHVRGVRFLVIDEADQLARSSAADAAVKLFGLLPRGGTGAARLQVLLLSATLRSPEVAGLSEQLCFHPQWVDLRGGDADTPAAGLSADVDHAMIMISATHPPAGLEEWRSASPAPVTDGVHARGGGGAGGEASEGIKRLKPLVLRALLESLDPGKQARVGHRGEIRREGRGGRSERMLPS